MGKRLFVGNLPYSANDAELKEIFSQVGTVESAQVIIEKMTGRSKGFGFVEMATDEEAAKAVETLNGKDFSGRPLVVNEARPMEPRAPRQGGFGGGRGGDNYGGGY
jgi:RNA recognition motif-containing protein